MSRKGEGGEDRNRHPRAGAAPGAREAGASKLGLRMAGRLEQETGVAPGGRASGVRPSEPGRPRRPLGRWMDKEDYVVGNRAGTGCGGEAPMAQVCDMLCAVRTRVGAPHPFLPSAPWMPLSLTQVQP